MPRPKSKRKLAPQTDTRWPRKDGPRYVDLGHLPVLVDPPPFIVPAGEAPAYVQNRIREARTVYEKPLRELRRSSGKAGKELYRAQFGDPPEAERGRRGGQAGAGKSKRQHTELIRRAVDALAEEQIDVSAANVRLLLKSKWEKLAREWDDPLHDIVDVSVREKGTVVIEYTRRWAAAHRGKQFIELDADALAKAIERARKNR